VKPKKRIALLAAHAHRLERPEERSVKSQEAKEPLYASYAPRLHLLYDAARPRKGAFYTPETGRRAMAGDPYRTPSRAKCIPAKCSHYAHGTMVGIRLRNLGDLLRSRPEPVSS
jgi:hypothetical protein